MSKRSTADVFGILAISLCTVHVEAQQYPSKPVRLIVPYAPGGGVDIMGRIAAQKYGERLGTQFIVENRAGGGTIIGTEAVARAAPDGYTLLFTNPALPNVPTIAESGYPGFEVNNWLGIVAPAQTPREIIARLNGEMNAILAVADVRERITSLGKR